MFVIERQKVNWVTLEKEYSTKNIHFDKGYLMIYFRLRLVLYYDVRHDYHSVAH